MQASLVSTPALPAAALEAASDIWSRLGSQHAIPVSGQSMWPTIRDGDRVWIAHGSDRVSRDDVIVYRTAGRLIVHRVVSIHRNGEHRRFTTRGDNSGHRDAPVELGQVVGQVIAVERRGCTWRMPTGDRRWLSWGVAWAVARLYAVWGRLH